MGTHAVVSACPYRKRHPHGTPGRRPRILSLLLCSTGRSQGAFLVARDGVVMQSSRSAPSSFPSILSQAFPLSLLDQESVQASLPMSTRRRHGSSRNYWDYNHSQSPRPQLPESSDEGGVQGRTSQQPTGAGSKARSSSRPA